MGLWGAPSCWRNMTVTNSIYYGVCSLQSLRHVRLFATPWTAARQASLSFTNSWILLKLMSSSQWCHPTISSSVILFSSCLQPFPVIGSFPMSKFFTSVGQIIGVSASASVLPMNINDWFPLAWIVGSLCSPRDSQESYPTPEFKTFNSSLLTILYAPNVPSIHENWKNHSFDYTELFQESNVSALKNAARLVIAFLQTTKHLLISWMQSSFAVILEPHKIKYLTVSIVSPSICHEVMGQNAMIFIFWMWSLS